MLFFAAYSLNLEIPINFIVLDYYVTNPPTPARGEIALFNPAK
jgi:hypothetical protein